MDFDDTLCNRGRQLQHPLLQDNRGDIWTGVSIRFFRRKTGNFFRLHFWKDTLSKDLSEITRRKPASILTASAAPWFQEEKINASFPDIHRIITRKGIDKPRAILDHILQWKIIPTEIDIFDDRPHNFYGVQDKKRSDTEMKLLSTLFPQTKFTLYYVEYAGREGEPTVTTDRIWHAGVCTYVYNPHVVVSRTHEMVWELLVPKWK